MAHIRSCLLVAQGAIIAGAALVAVTRHALYLRRGANYSLAHALGGGAIGGLLGAAAGCAICVARDGTANPGGGWLAAWMFRFLPFGAAGIIEGAMMGLLLGLAIALIAARSARRSARRSPGVGQ